VEQRPDCCSVRRQSDCCVGDRHPLVAQGSTIRLVVEPEPDEFGRVAESAEVDGHGVGPGPAVGRDEAGIDVTCMHTWQAHVVSDLPCPELFIWPNAGADAQVLDVLVGVPASSAIETTVSARRDCTR